MNRDISKGGENREESISKDQFFSIISHDLRNPISAIKTLTEFLFNDFENLPLKEVKEFIRLIFIASNSSQKLLENLLQWSLSRDGNLHLSPENIDIYDILSNKIEFFLEDARRKGITFNSTVEKDTYVFADSKTVKIIIRNLVSNAVKFTSGGGKISVSSKDVNDYIEITVSDTGTGIKEDDMTKLFAPDSLNKRHGTEGEYGTGLGLLLCKDLVEKNKGKIWVESIIGKGSDFKFTLPKGNKSDVAAS